MFMYIAFCKLHYSANYIKLTGTTAFEFINYQLSITNYHKI